MPCQHSELLPPSWCIVNSSSGRERKGPCTQNCCCCGAALAASGLVERLLGLAEATSAGLSASDIAFLLDGCARLSVRPPAPFLEAMADEARLWQPWKAVAVLTACKDTSAIGSAGTIDAQLWVACMYAVKNNCR